MISRATIEELSSVDSTNAEAMRRVQAGEQGPLWIIAQSQTAGRGRSGRNWTSETGNLHASLLVTLVAPQPKAYQLALVAGVAVFDGIAAAMQPSPPALRLKWPNDIMIDGVKTGGILVESSLGSQRLAAVIGIGLNIAATPAALDRPTTCLSVHGTCPEPRQLLEFLAEAMASWLAAWDEGRGFDAVREAWLNRAHPVGERMSVNTGSELVAGTFQGLDADGALLLEVGGAVRKFTFGDVTLAR